MQRHKKRIVLISLACFMLIIATACSGGKGANNTSQSASTQSNNNQSASTTSQSDTSSTSNSSAGDTDWSKQPELTLDVCDNLANASGIQGGWFGHLVKEKFNLKLNIIQCGKSGVLATRMAAGNIGDLIIALGGKQYEDAIKQGLILDWTKDGMLDKYGKNIEKYAPKALDANRQQYGGGKAVYGIGNQVGDGEGPSEGSSLTYGPYLRWDLYQKLGSPKIKTLDDYLPLLKKMQQLDPTSDSGKKTYGFSLWKDWDGSGSSNAGAIMALYGYGLQDGFNSNDFLIVKANSNEYQSMLDKNSLYMKGLKFYFDANQMGLVNPDSVTQHFGDVWNQYADGQVLFGEFSWLGGGYNSTKHTDQGKGFALVPFENETALSQGFSPYGGNWGFSIGAKTKDPKRVIAFLNYFYSPQGMEEASLGWKGWTWTLDQNGKPVLTDYGKKAVADPKNTPVPAKYGGGNYSAGQGNMGNINDWTLNLNAVNPETGEPYNYQLWKSYLTDNPNPVVKSWRNAMGALTDTEWFLKNKKVVVQKPYFNPKAPATLPSKLQLEHDQIAKVVKEYSWKMMFAKNQAEFDSLQNEMISKAKGLGYDDVFKWDLEQAQKTVFTQYK